MTAVAPTSPMPIADKPAPEAEPPRSLAAPEAARPTAWVASTYFTEGLPYSLVHKIVGQEYLTAAGFPVEVLGFASLLHLPWLVKFLWAPVVDRHATAKRWMVGIQLALALCTLLIAFSAQRLGPLAIALALIVAAFLAATNDVAIDGYYIRSLDKQRQTQLSGARIGAYRIALLVGAGPIVAIAGWTSFPAALCVVAGVLATFAVMHALWLREDVVPVRRDTAARTAGLAASSFFSQPGIVIAMCVLLTYRAGDALLFAMNPKFLQGLGLDTAMRGLINGTLGTAASIAGSLVGGLVIARSSFAKTFFPITLLQSAALLLYVGLAVGQPSFAVIAVVVIVEQFVAGAGTAAFTVFILRLCHGEQKASHFAFASSLMSVAATVAGVASGFLFKSLGPPSYFLVAFLASLPGVVAALFVRKV